MKQDIVIPAVGESITEATIAEWQKSDGDFVDQNDILLVLETDKASVEVVAEYAGLLTIKVPEGETVDIGAVVAQLDTDAKAPAKGSSASTAPQQATPTTVAQTSAPQNSSGQGQPGPAAKKILNEKNMTADQVQGTGPKNRVTKDDAKKAQPAHQTKAPMAPVVTASGGERREKMSSLRKKIAQRLVEAQQTAAILTTFNEVDMTEVMSLRTKYKDSFEKRHGVRLGFMGFFVKATLHALNHFPQINAFIDGDELIFHDYVNMGIAIGGPKGLLVPVLKQAQNLSLAEVEMGIKDYATKAKNNKISIDDLSGGTFTISNGGVYGSLMSTPILNPPQSGILGMHKIEKRPVAIDGKVEIRPMMYLALSYDHRVVDGKESVSFLVKIKEALEDPTRLILDV